MTDTPVHSLIPHSDTMVLLDQILSRHEHGLTASVTITSDSLFAEAEGVPSWIGLEYMGQAIAAFAGITAREQNEPVRIGFLVSTRRYEPSIAHFTPGMSLIISIEAITFNTTGLRVFECSIAHNQQQLVSANLNVFMPEDINAFMKESAS